MNPTEVIPSKVKRKSRLHVLQLFRESIRQACESPQLHPNRQVLRRGNLIALRELALRQVAEQVDRSLESYMEAQDIRKNWGVRERMAVCISSNPTGQYLIARGRPFSIPNQPSYSLLVRNPS